MADTPSIIVRPVTEPTIENQWQPAIGSETQEFLAHVVPQESRDEISTSAAAILGRGVNPDSPNCNETGLVVGYVQSGKTMSFETVAVLARDNGFQVVIVVAGTSNPLLEQSTGRISRDLRLNEPNRARNWIHFQNPENDDPTVQTLRDVLEDWRDEETPDEYKKTVLVTVLKHHGRLANLTRLLEAVGMDQVPALIIDDEADQASLNTEVGQGEESSTYTRLMEMSAALPLHTYLQYTATPQAPLLISIRDALSPNFVEVLTPGEAYVGGRDFFRGDLNLVRTIPPGDVPTRGNPLTEPPTTLLEALRLFMIGVVIGLKQDGNAGNRSMLVHPSHLTAQHREYYNWVRDIFEEWKRILNLGDDDPDKIELLNELRGAYDDVASTTESTIPSFDDLAPDLRFAFRQTRLREVNASRGPTEPVDWRSAYAWILVGGQAMDRGFTVEGLTVTYMPRGIGVGNADTVQQRARFFGYKRTYLGLCRVFLEQGTHRAFQTYVEHEEDMRAQLEHIRDTGRSLNEWKRSFFLDRALRPCRQNVLEFDYIRGEFSERWIAPRVVAASKNVIDENREIVSAFVGGQHFEDDSGHAERTAEQRHQVARGLSLELVMEELLIPMRIPNSRDSQHNTGLLLQLSKALEENPDETCDVYTMSPHTRRRRSVDDAGKVLNLYQGAAPVQPRERRGEVYPGDIQIRQDGQVTVQIHTLDLTESRSGPVIEENVSVLAVWVPSRLAASWIHQDQPGQDS